MGKQDQSSLGVDTGAVFGRGSRPRMRWSGDNPIVHFLSMLADRNCLLPPGNLVVLRIWWRLPGVPFFQRVFLLREPGETPRQRGGYKGTVRGCATNGSSRCAGPATVPRRCRGRNPLPGDGHSPSRPALQPMFSEGMSWKSLQSGDDGNWGSERHHSASGGVTMTPTTTNFDQDYRGPDCHGTQPLSRHLGRSPGTRASSPESRRRHCRGLPRAQAALRPRNPDRERATGSGKTPFKVVSVTLASGRLREASDNYVGWKDSRKMNQVGQFQPVMDTIRGTPPCCHGEIPSRACGGQAREEIAGGGGGRLDKGVARSYVRHLAANRMAQLFCRLGGSAVFV